MTPRKTITVFGNRLQMIDIVDQAAHGEIVKLVLYRNYGDGKNWKPKVATVEDWVAWDLNARRCKK